MGHAGPWAALAAAGTMTVLAGPARASTVACWFENGALVVPAALDDMAGDWIIDFAAKTTLLHETRAQMEGVEGTATTGALRFAGERIEALPATVESLDARAPGFVPPLVGVIGDDVLGRYVVDIDFAPCRISFHAPGRAPRVRGQALPLTLVDGRPTVRAAVADGAWAVAGPFVIDTASKAAVRLPLPPAMEGAAARGDGRQQAPGVVRAFSLGGRLFETPGAARGAELPAGVVGAVGTEALSRWRLRIDIAGGRLTLIDP